MGTKIKFEVVFPTMDQVTLRDTVNDHFEMQGWSQVIPADVLSLIFMGEFDPSEYKITKEVFEDHEEDDDAEGTAFTRLVAVAMDYCLELAKSTVQEGRLPTKEATIDVTLAGLRENLQDLL